MEGRIRISIEKYDLLFDQWVEETNAYIDQYNLSNVMKRFDESCGLCHAMDDESITHDKYDFYSFDIVDGKKFLVSVFKYDLNSKDNY